MALKGPSSSFRVKARGGGSIASSLELDLSLLEGYLF